MNMGKMETMPDKQAMLSYLKEVRRLVNLGWTKGALARLANGCITTRENDPDVTGRCLVGCIDVVVPTAFDRDVLCCRLVQYARFHGHDPSWRARDVLISFNDAQATGKQDVLDLIDVTVERLEER
jgi:hypothetical protein